MNSRSFSVSVETALTKREAKAQETKLRLVDTALELFARQGYEATSVKEIAQAAGVAQGLLYTHFASKEDLFWGILERYSFAPHLREMMAEAEHRPAAEVLREAGERFHAFLSARQPLMRLIIGEAQSNPKVAAVFARYLQEEAGAFHRYLQARIAAGELRPHDTQVTLRMLITPIIGIYLFGLPLLGDPKDFIANIVQTLLYGLRPTGRIIKWKRLKLMC